MNEINASKRLKEVSSHSTNRVSCVIFWGDTEGPFQTKRSALQSAPKREVRSTRSSSVSTHAHLSQAAFEKAEGEKTLLVKSAEAEALLAGAKAEGSLFFSFKKVSKGFLNNRRKGGTSTLECVPIESVL